MQVGVGVHVPKKLVAVCVDKVVDLRDVRLKRDQLLFSDDSLRVLGVSLDHAPVQYWRLARRLLNIKNLVSSVHVAPNIEILFGFEVGF